MAGPRTQRADYGYTTPLQTRWQDNDVYGHVNNVVYYALFDSIVNRMLVERGLLNITSGQEIGLVVDSGCSYFAPAAFPDALQGGLRIGHLGKSSVRYELAIFKEGSDNPIAEGHFVHVFVDRDSRRPVPMSQDHRTVFAALQA